MVIEIHKTVENGEDEEKIIDFGLFGKIIKLSIISFISYKIVNKIYTSGYYKGVQVGTKYTVCEMKQTTN